MNSNEIKITGKVLEKKPSDPHLFNLSVSKSKTFESCKAKYKFTYIEKLPKKEWEFQVFGKFVHEVLEHFHLSLMAQPLQSYHLLMKRQFLHSLTHFVLSPSQKAEAFDILSRYLLLLANEKKRGIEPTILAAEKDFYINIDDKILLLGFIDRIQLDPDGVLHVTDYKTSAKTDYLKKDWVQLLTYAYALWLEDPSLEKIRGSYIMLKLKKDDGTLDEIQSISRDFTIPEIMAMEDVFRQYAVKIAEEKEFAPKPSPLCMYCDGIDICTEGQNFMTKLKPNPNFGIIDW